MVEIKFATYLSAKHKDLGALLDRLLTSDKMPVYQDNSRCNLYFMKNMRVTFEELIIWGIQKINYHISEGDEKQVKSMTVYLNILLNYAELSKLEINLICPNCGKLLKMDTWQEGRGYAGTRALFQKVVKYKCTNCNYLNAYEEAIISSN